MPFLDLPPEPPALSVSYFGETISHPGLMVAIERTLGRMGAHAFFIDAEAGGYTHPRNHTGLVAAGDLGYRLSATNGWSFEAAVGAGVMDVSLAAPVYTTGAFGQDGGRAALMPRLSIGAGYALGAIGLPGQRAYARLVGFGEYPTNTMLLPHLAFQTGLQWSLGGNK